MQRKQNEAADFLATSIQEGRGEGCSVDLFGNPFSDILTTNWSNSWLDPLLPLPALFDTMDAREAFLSGAPLWPCV